jgi:hypothetical protein
MGAYSSGKLSGITSNLALVGFFCIGMALFAIAATIVLSLISLYIPNHSQPGYGERKYKQIIFKNI